jgi:hypothetical protein
VVYQVNGSRAEGNPAAARLRELAGRMPDASVAGSVNVNARTITRAEYERAAALRDAPIAASRTGGHDATAARVASLR